MSKKRPDRSDDPWYANFGSSGSETSDSEVPLRNVSPSSGSDSDSSDSDSPSPVVDTSKTRVPVAQPKAPPAPSGGGRQLPFTNGRNNSSAAASASAAVAREVPAAVEVPDNVTSRRWFMQVECNVYRQYVPGSWVPPGWPDTNCSDFYSKEDIAHFWPLTGFFYNKHWKACGWMDVSLARDFKSLLTHVESPSATRFYTESSLTSCFEGTYEGNPFKKVRAAVQVYIDFATPDETLKEQAQIRLRQRAADLRHIQCYRNKKHTIAVEPQGILERSDTGLQLTKSDWKKMFAQAATGVFHGKKGHASAKDMKTAKARLTPEEQLAKLYENNVKYESMPMENVRNCPRFALRPHQQKGLKWMLDRESSQELGPHWEGAQLTVAERMRGVESRGLHTGGPTPSPLVHCIFDDEKKRRRRNEVRVPRGGIVADEMGLGKTRQMLAVCAKNPLRHTLIVAPPAVLYDVWAAEINNLLVSNPLFKDQFVLFLYHENRKELPADNCIVNVDTEKDDDVEMNSGSSKKPTKNGRSGTSAGELKGSKSSKKQTAGGAASKQTVVQERALEPHQHSITLTSYETFVSAAKSFQTRKWGRVILDEAHEIRNRTGNKFKQIEGLKETEKRCTWLLTATPFVNKAEDLYSLFSLLQVEPFRQNYTAFGANIVAPWKQSSLVGLERANMLLRFFMLRRRKNDQVRQPGELVAGPLLKLPRKHEKSWSMPLDKARNPEHLLMCQNLLRFAEKEIAGPGSSCGQGAIALHAISKLRQLHLSPLMIPQEWRAVLAQPYNARNIMGLFKPQPKSEVKAQLGLLDPNMIKPGTTIDKATAVVSVKRGQVLTTVQHGENDKSISKTVEEIFQGALDEPHGCSICMEDMEISATEPKQNSSVCCLLACLHCFHTACLEEALKTRRECPYCRAPVADTQYMCHPPKGLLLDGVSPQQGRAAGKASPGNNSASSSAAVEAISVIDSGPLRTAEEREQFANAPKVNAILKLVREARPGEPLLIFSSFTTFLQLLQHACVLDATPNGVPLRRCATGILRGGLTPHRRSGLVQAFQNGEIDVMFCSLKAAGVGITLTKAKKVVLCEPHWNLPMEEQAIARAHRFGLDHDIDVIRLITTFPKEKASSASATSSSSSSSASSRSGTMEISSRIQQSATLPHAVSELSIEERMLHMQQQKNDIGNASANTKISKEEMDKQKEKRQGLMFDLLRGSSLGNKRVQPWVQNAQTVSASSSFGAKRQRR
ncbi:unnamed protein product [Amoebophrya sp. A120]|nr:unnamed protein product [Amoebophrya sp. A120]|eukprot:GSA120T00002357001.1